MRLFFAYLKAGSDQRQILTSSRGNAARADQYTEQVFAKNQHYHPTEQDADSSEVPLNCNLSCQMYNEGCVDDNRNSVINDNCGRILRVITNKLYVYSNYSVHRKEALLSNLFGTDIHTVVKPVRFKQKKILIKTLKVSP